MDLRPVLWASILKLAVLAGVVALQLIWFLTRTALRASNVLWLLILVRLERPEQVLASGTLGFWFEYGETSATGYALKFSILEASNQFTNVTIWNSSNDMAFYASGLTYPTIFYNVEKDVWHYFIFEWKNTNQVRFNLDGSWTDWKTPAYSRATISRFESLVQTGVGAYVVLDHFTDDPVLACSLEYCELCTTYYNCASAGCSWYYHPLYGNYCSEMPGGECYSGIYGCENCATIENCEAEQYCYWFEGNCRFGTGVCGPGVKLQFCETQETCEAQSGYWYGGFCWSDEAPEIIDWETYYGEYGDYATASDWIISIASSSTGFFENVGGFLTTFKNFFDLQSAYQKGLEFGSAIPSARGYLAIFDDFLGVLPVSGLFLFILGFMLAVGVFRVVRNLIQLIKFW